MEQKFGKNSIDIEALREFCEREGKEVTYRKGEQFEREGDPARWFEHKGSGTMCYVADFLLLVTRFVADFLYKDTHFILFLNTFCRLKMRLLSQFNYFS